MACKYPFKTRHLLWKGNADDTDEHVKIHMKIQMYWDSEGVKTASPKHRWQTHSLLSNFSQAVTQKNLPPFHVLWLFNTLTQQNEVLPYVSENEMFFLHRNTSFQCCFTLENGNKVIWKD